ncbi:glycosyltransferase family 1 protein [Lactiplantibacillus plantarum]|jgi:glycosyltransferase EpsF|nr:glycosyltransferase family 1 protein [Lactiplantibacillus plantarum]
MVKVLQVFNKLNQGGIEHVVINLMQNIDRDKIEFHFAMTSGEKGLLDEKVKKLGGYIHYFNSGSRNPLNVKKNLERIIRDNGPFDVVHSHIYFASGYILYIAKKMGVPIRIAHAHDTYKGEKKTLIRKVYEYKMRKMINKYANYKFGVSKEAIFHLFGNKDQNTYIVNNGINFNEYVVNENIRKYYRSKFHVKDNETLLCNIGRFEDQKDHNYLIDVFNRLLKINKNYKLLLIGNGSLKKAIISKVEKLGLSSKVVFLENRNDVNKILMATDMFIMPSKYEGLPLSLIEAQASGIPCVISNNITDEVKISPNVYSLEKDNYNRWINFIIQHKNDPRLNNIEYLDNAGFNEIKIAKFVENIYLS